MGSEYGEKTESPLVASLFPSAIPPSINFCSSSSSPTDQAKRRHLFGHLKWIQTTSPFLHQVISATGFTLVPVGTADWFGFLNEGFDRRCPQRDPRNVLRSPNQKYSIMPGSETLCHKVEFWKHYKRYQQKFGAQEFDWHLPAFVLPDEMEQFKEQFLPGDTWIYKPSTTSCLEGIKIIRNIASFSNTQQEEESAVVQLFLPNPFLLNGGKVEPRISVLITSIHPLRIYVFDDGVVKIFSNYKAKMEQNSEENIALVNMKGEERSSLKEFFPQMSKQGHDIERMKEEMYDIIIKALIMGEKKMTMETTKWLPAKGTAYQYWSADFMFDSDLKPFLIEMNRFPAYWCADQYEFYRRHMVDMFNLVGYKVPALNVQKKEIANSVGNGYMHGGIAQDVEVKLSAEDVRELMDGEDELHRMNGTGFTRIFPTSKTSKYFKYLETDFHPYIVQHQWEVQFENCREDAVATLRNLCSNACTLS